MPGIDIGPSKNEKSYKKVIDKIGKYSRKEERGKEEKKPRGLAMILAKIRGKRKNNPNY
jgi:hypothetical protein